MSYLVRWKTAVNVLSFCCTFSVVLGAPQGTVGSRNIISSNGPFDIAPEIDPDDFRSNFQLGTINNNGPPIALTRAWVNFGNSAGQQGTGISLREANNRQQDLTVSLPSTQFTNSRQEQSQNIGISLKIANDHSRDTHRSLPQSPALNLDPNTFSISGISLNEANTRLGVQRESTAGVFLSGTGHQQHTRTGVSLTEANENIRSLQASSSPSLPGSLSELLLQRAGITLAEANNRLRSVQGSSTGGQLSQSRLNQIQRTGISLFDVNERLENQQSNTPAVSLSGSRHQQPQRIGITLSEANEILRLLQGSSPRGKLPSSGQHQTQGSGISLFDANDRLRNQQGFSQNQQPHTTGITLETANERSRGFHRSGSGQQPIQKPGISLNEANKRLLHSQSPSFNSNNFNVNQAAHFNTRNIGQISSPFYVKHDSDEELDFSFEDSSSSSEIVLSLGRRYHPHGIPIISKTLPVQPSPTLGNVQKGYQQFTNPFIQTLNSVFFDNQNDDLSNESDYFDSHEDEDDDDIIVHLSPMIRAQNYDASDERLTLSNDFMSQYNFVDTRGSTNWGYKTDDQYQAHKVHDDGTMEGQFGWTSPEGSQVKIKYIADKGGYRVISQSGTYLNDEKDVRLAKEQHFAAHEIARNRIKNVKRKNYREGELGIPLPSKNNEQNTFSVPHPNRQSTGISLPVQRGNVFQSDPRGVPLPNRNFAFRPDLNFGIPLISHDQSFVADPRQSIGIPLPGSNVKFPNLGQNFASVQDQSLGIPLSNQNVKFPISSSIAGQKFGISLPGQNIAVTNVPNDQRINFDEQTNIGIALPEIIPNQFDRDANFDIIPDRGFQSFTGTPGISIPQVTSGISKRPDIVIPIITANDFISFDNTGQTTGISLPGSAEPDRGSNFGIISNDFIQNSANVGGVSLPQTISNVNRQTEIFIPSTSIHGADQNIGISLPESSLSPFANINPNEVVSEQNFQFDQGISISTINQSPNIQGFGIPLSNIHSNVNIDGGPSDLITPFGIDGVELPQQFGVNIPSVISNDPGFIQSGPISDFSLISANQFNNNDQPVQFETGTFSGTENLFNQLSGSSIGSDHGIELPQSSGPGFVQTEPLDDFPLAASTAFGNDIASISLPPFTDSSPNIIDTANFAVHSPTEGFIDQQGSRFSGTEQGINLPQFTGGSGFIQTEGFVDSPLQSTPADVQLSFTTQFEEPNINSQPSNNQNFGLGLPQQSNFVNDNFKNENFVNDNFKNQNFGLDPISSDQGHASNIGIRLPTADINPENNPPIDLGTGSGGFFIVSNDEARFGLDTRGSSLGTSLNLNSEFVANVNEQRFSRNTDVLQGPTHPLQ